jgi:uncharacterized protein
MSIVTSTLSYLVSLCYNRHACDPTNAVSLSFTALRADDLMEGRDMHIDRIICPEDIAEKLAVKHHVRVHDARSVLYHATRIRFAEQGYTPGEDVYAAFGQTLGGRYLVVFFVYKPDTSTAIIISARDMSDKERKTYGRK